MPPVDSEQPDPSEKSEFIQNTTSWITEFQKKKFAKLGRVRSRRLTNLQLERTLHDLLAIDLPLATRLTDELRPTGFNNIADARRCPTFICNHIWLWLMLHWKLLSPKSLIKKSLCHELDAVRLSRESKASMPRTGTAGWQSCRMVRWYHMATAINDCTGEWLVPVLDHGIFPE